MLKALLLTVAVTACAPRPRIVASPEQRAEALQLYAAGSSTRDVAAQLRMDPADARHVLRTALVQLNRRLYREH